MFPGRLPVDPETVSLQYIIMCVFTVPVHGSMEVGIYSAVWCMLRAIVYTTVDTGKINMSAMLA
jgi:hypothetical protein